MAHACDAGMQYLTKSLKFYKVLTESVCILNTVGYSSIGVRTFIFSKVWLGEQGLGEHGGSF